MPLFFGVFGPRADFLVRQELPEGLGYDLGQWAVDRPGVILQLFHEIFGDSHEKVPGRVGIFERHGLNLAIFRPLCPYDIGAGSDSTCGIEIGK